MRHYAMDEMGRVLCKYIIGMFAQYNMAWYDCVTAKVYI